VSEDSKVWVFVMNGTMTSAGSGPGARELPPGEAGAPVGAKLAIYGDQPPRGW
jgi:hypothetical protein